MTRRSGDYASVFYGILLRAPVPGGLFTQCILCAGIAGSQPQGSRSPGAICGGCALLWLPLSAGHYARI